MIFFDGFILNTILLLFPLLLYIVYVACKKDISKPEMTLFFEFALVLSVLLISWYGKSVNNGYVTVLINIPLLFAYLKGRKVSIGIISFILVFYYIVYLKYPPNIIIFEYIIYFVLYLYTKKKAITSTFIIDSFTIIKAFFISFLTFYFVNPDGNLLSNLFKIILSIIILNLASICYYKLIRKIENMVSFNNTLKELEKEKMIRNSLFKITHEIKNPIAVCKGYLDMIDLNNKNKVDKYIPIIKSEINRTLTLMDDYLDYSKIKINKDIIDIIMLVEDTLKSMDVLLKDSKVNVSYEISEEEVYMMADYNRLKQVLINLIKNSMESKLEERNLNVKIKTVIDNNNIQIIIEDNGEGMTRDELNHLGEAFYTTKINGTGIGVNLSKEIVERHNGTIVYESEKYVGTKVTITFPIDKELNI